MFRTKHSKTNRLQKTIKYKTNKQNRLENIHIEMCKQKYNQVRLVLEVFASTKLALNCIKQARSKIILATFDLAYLVRCCCMWRNLSTDLLYGPTDLFLEVDWTGLEWINSMMLHVATCPLICYKRRWTCSCKMAGLGWNGLTRNY